MNKELKVKRAVSILNTAKENGIEVQIPDDDTQKIKVAEKLVDKARTAMADGQRGPAVSAILFSADVEIGGKPEPVDIPNDPDWQTYQDALNFKFEPGIPIPAPIEGEVPEFPIDLTELSDHELRYLHGAFNAVAARIGYLYAREEAGEAAAKQLADYYENNYIINLGDKRKDFGGKAKSNALLKAEAEANVPEVEKWRRIESGHAIKVNHFKRMLEVYTTNCDRLSREYTMRSEERQHA